MVSVERGGSVYVHCIAAERYEKGTGPVGAVNGDEGRPGAGSSSGGSRDRFPGLERPCKDLAQSRGCADSTGSKDELLLSADEWYVRCRDGHWVLSRERQRGRV